jgi:hypothetical protein
MTNIKDETCPVCGDKFGDYFNRPVGEDRCPTCVDESEEYDFTFVEHQEHICNKEVAHENGNLCGCEVAHIIRKEREKAAKKDENHKTT